MRGEASRHLNRLEKNSYPSASSTFNKASKQTTQQHTDVPVGGKTSRVSQINQGQIPTFCLFSTTYYHVCHWLLEYKHSSNVLSTPHQPKSCLQHAEKPWSHKLEIYIKKKKTRLTPGAGPETAENASSMLFCIVCCDVILTSSLKQFSSMINNDETR